jgi:hypothetical protein
MGWVVNTMPQPLYPRERPGSHCILVVLQKSKYCSAFVNLVKVWSTLRGTFGFVKEEGIGGEIGKLRYVHSVPNTEKVEIGLM